MIRGRSWIAFACLFGWFFGWLPLALPASGAESLGRIGLVYEGKLPFLMELERELQFSSFDVTRVESAGPEEDWIPKLARFEVEQGILITDGGQKAVLFFIEKGKLRVDGQYPISQQDRLARRRLWIWLGEHLRALAESQQESPPTATPIRVTEPRRPLPALDTIGDRPRELRPFSLGAASMLGYGRGTAFLGSHILLTGSMPIQERMALFANLLWPLLAVAEDSMAVARSWTFQTQVGCQIFLGPMDWWFRPYAGLGTGAQFMMIEVTQGAGGFTNTRGSVIGVAQAGSRFYLSDGLALFLHVEAGYSQPMGGDTSDLKTDPAKGLFRRVGLGLVFDR